ncbi:MAG: amidohydrolase [Isosphaera sp.]|nr:amidohydrolase [Isosphaera sp.]
MRRGPYHLATDLPHGRPPPAAGSRPVADSFTLTARWVFPVSGPPLPNGTVTVRGDRVEAVDARGVRSADEDLGNVAIVPGLVNVHTHLDLSGARGLIPPTDPDHFTDWLRGVIAYRRSRTAEQVQADVRAGLAECMRFGTTLVGDITAGGASWPAVSTAATRAVLFWEVIGLTAERYQPVLNEFGTKAGLSWSDDTPAVYPATPLCRWAVSPHAPYSANHDYARGQLLMGNVAIHLAESPAELELLATRTGPFVLLLKDLGAWEPAALTAGLLDFFPTRPTLTSPPVLYVHCNYLPPDTPFAPSQSVVYCPRTHAAFGHPPHPFRDFLARGVRVCLATDSLASNPDLDVLAEARFVHSRHPDFPPDRLLRMITADAADALGWGDACGSLEPGKSADLVAVPLPDRDAADPHDLLFADHPGGRRTLFRGTWRA